ncbi:MAG: hypothetical protein AAGI92_02685 [Pseudomonadota bacterium]
MNYVEENGQSRSTVDKLQIALSSHPQGMEHAEEALRSRFTSWLTDYYKSDYEDDRRKKVQLRFESALSDAKARMAALDDEHSDVVISDEKYKAYQDDFEEKKMSGTTKALTAAAAAIFVGGFIAWQTGVIGPQNNEADNQAALFQLTADTTINVAPRNEFSRDQNGIGITARSTHDNPASGQTTNSVFFTIPAEIEEAVGGKTIRVSITAASAADNGSEEFAVSYSTAAVGNSGWQRFVLQREAQTFDFTYDVPNDPQNRDPQLDYLGVWADTEGLGRSVKIDEIRVDIAE